MKKDQVKETLNQMGGMGKIRAMIGVHSLRFLDNGFAFKFKGSRKYNTLEIRLNSMDLYELIFSRITMKGKANIQEYKDVYCDQLIDIFESTTGLYLSL